MADWSWESERYDWEAVGGKLDLPAELMAGLKWQGMWTFGGNGMTRFWATEVTTGEEMLPGRRDDLGLRHSVPPHETVLTHVVIDTSERVTVNDKGGRKRQAVIAKRSYRRIVRLVGAGIMTFPYSHTEGSDAP